MKRDPVMNLDGRNGLWSIPAWCSQFGCSEVFYYSLDPGPRTVRFGKRLVRIVESPAGYAERIGSAAEVRG